MAVDPTSGTMIASSGFEVARDGFSFANWGRPDETHRRGLTPTMMQSLYGDRICARIENGECVLTATGQALQTDLDESASGGHCFGFAALAGLFSTDGLDKGAYLRTGPDVYAEPASDYLDGLITRYFSTQISQPTGDQMGQRFSVAETLERLQAAWVRGENYMLAFFGAPGGHAVTPVAIRDLGDGKTGIVVYDNNFPGVEKMMVADAAADTWYYTTALNPADKSYLFVGSPTNQLVLIDPATTTAVHECPICRDEGDDSVLVMVKDNAENSDGTNIGWDLTLTTPGGDEIPGLEPVEMINEKQGAVFRVPAGIAFRATLTGAPFGRTADIDISLYGDGWINEIDEIALAPRATATVDVDENQRKVSLSGNRTFNPLLMLASEQADRSVAARGTGLRVLPGTTLSVERDIDGDYVYALDGIGVPGSLTLDLRHRDTIADRHVTTDGPVTIPVNSSASVAAHGWDGTTPISVRISGDGGERSYPMVPGS